MAEDVAVVSLERGVAEMELREAAGGLVAPDGTAPYQGDDGAPFQQLVVVHSFQSFIPKVNSK